MWVDNANSWHNMSNVSKLAGRVKEYGAVAATMSKNWECILYVTAGKMVTPRWESMSTPSSRQLHGRIIDELKNYTKQVMLIDDLRIGVRTQYPEFGQPSDKGRRLGYACSANEPHVDSERAGILTARLTA